MAARRWGVALAITTAVVVSLAACASAGNGAAAGPTTTGAPTTLAPSTANRGTSSPPAVAPKASSPDGGSFVLTAGAEHQVCGIALRVRFIPPSGMGNSDQAFLVATAPGEPDPDQPTPGTVAPANPGSTATVLGKRFKVLAVDPSHGRVSLDALC